MLKYHIINLASCRLCPRRAAGGKERRYMDQNDKNKSNKNNDRRKGVLSLLIWALVLTIGFNYLLSAMDTRKLAESTCEIRYDEFLDLVRDGKVKEVEIADRTLNITPVDGFTYTDADGKTYSGDFQLFTTQINDPELRSFLDENGVEFGKPYKAEADAAEAAEAAAPGLFADEAHHQDERADHQRRGQDVVEHDDLKIRGLRLVGLAELHAVFIQERPQLGVVDLRGEELEVP